MPKLSFLASLAGLAALAQAPAENPAESRRIAAAETRIVHFVVDGKDTAVYTLTEDHKLACWPLAKQQALWHSTEPRLGDSRLCLGAKFLYVGSVWPSVYSVDPESGKQGQGVGAGAPTTRAFAYAADDRDRWVWIADSDGLVHRVIPSNVQAFNRRNLKNGGATALALDPDGELLAVGGADRTIRFVGASSATVDEKKVFEGHGDSISALAFGGKGTLVSGAKDGGLRIWAMNSGRVRAELSGHAAAISALCCDAKGTRAASGDASGKICVWDVARGKLLATFQSAGEIGALAFLEKQKLLLASDGGSALVAWALEE